MGNKSWKWWGLGNQQDDDYVYMYKKVGSSRSDLGGQHQIGIGILGLDNTVGVK